LCVFVRRFTIVFSKHRLQKTGMHADAGQHQLRPCARLASSSVVMATASWLCTAVFHLGGTLSHCHRAEQGQRLAKKWPSNSKSASAKVGKILSCLYHQNLQTG
jgi:hypothetical protein